MIPLYKPMIKRKEMDALLSTLVSDYIESENGNDELLKDLSSYLKLESGALLRDYSTAISIALKSLNFNPGSKILISALSPSVYIKEFEKLSIIPVYADVDLSSGCIDPVDIEKFVNSGIDGIVLYSGNGIAPDYEVYSELKIPVIEDITTTIGCHAVKDEPAWNPDIVILRMELQDIITSGEGTAVFSGNKAVLSALKNILTDLPLTSFLLNMHAAMGLIQLDSIDHFLERRREIGEIFESSLLKGHHKSFHSLDNTLRNYPSFHVILDSPFKEVGRYVRKNGVRVEMAFSDSALTIDPSITEKCPNANSLHIRTAVFPLYPGLGNKNTLIISKLLSTLP